MTKLSTHLTIEQVKQIKNFEEIFEECHDQWQKIETRGRYNKKEYYYDTTCRMDDEQRAIAVKEYPAPTIADIIDNAEELFGINDMYVQIDFIMHFCKENKPIEEIGDYIINNLK